jgi:hypothetical protein
MRRGYSRRLGSVALLAMAGSACGGAAPLMHTAHPMKANEVTMGAGFSGVVPIAPSQLSTDDIDARVAEEAAFAPGLAPWVGGRIGFDGTFDAGITYSARSIRVDARSAFVLDGLDLSVGLGASGLLPKRDDDVGTRVGGVGADLPFLIGFTSNADIYSVYLGARGGIEHLTGIHELDRDPLDPTAPIQEDLSGWHAQAGGLLGFRVGFRYIFAVLEVGGAMHWADVDVGDDNVAIEQFSLAPAGALLGRF